MQVHVCAMSNSPIIIIFPPESQRAAQRGDVWKF
jgi:hypothetical protein